MALQTRMLENHWLVEARSKLDRRSVLVEHVPRGGIELRATPYDVAFFVEGCALHTKGGSLLLPEPNACRCLCKAAAYDVA